MALKQIEDETPALPLHGWPVWRLGLRPMYLLAASFALLAIPLWLLMFQGWIRVSGLSGIEWHAHEMLFGYAVAVMAGFLLTAVQNWTGESTLTGKPLAALALWWLAARLLLPLAPLWLAAPVDLSFLPALAFILRRRLKRSSNRRNDFVPRLLLTLSALNAGFYLAHMGYLCINPLLPLQATLYLITVLEVIIAGRIVPMFTRNAVLGVVQSRVEWIERWVAPLTLITLLANLVPTTSWLLTAANLGLAGLHLRRWLGWAPFACWKQPLLWILHLGYLCIVIGFLLAALAGRGWIPWSAVLHLFAIGALGGLTLGMMTRTALGHTGRLLSSGISETVVYGAIMLAVVFRVTPLLLPNIGNYLTWLWAAAGCWSLAFMVYLLRYTPILISARADGKSG